MALLVFATQVVTSRGAAIITTNNAATTTNNAASIHTATTTASGQDGAEAANVEAAAASAVRNRGLYYAVFLSLLDVGDSVSDWATAPIVKLLGLEWDNFRSVRLTRACLFSLSVCRFVCGCREQLAVAVDDGGECDGDDVGDDVCDDVGDDDECDDDDDDDRPARLRTLSRTPIQRAPQPHFPSAAVFQLWARFELPS